MQSEKDKASESLVDLIQPVELSILRSVPAVKQDLQSNGTGRFTKNRYNKYIEDFFFNEGGTGELEMNNLCFI